MHLLLNRDNYCLAFSLISSVLIATSGSSSALGTEINPVKKYRLDKILKDPDRDISPAPNYRGAFVSLGATHWRKPENISFTGAAVDSVDLKKEPAADCSTETIVYFAEKAPAKFQLEQSGLLYGIKTHTPATRVDNIPGYNSCALVVHAILKKAGCTWSTWTANAKTVYDQAWKQGWQPTDVQRAGCIVAWNAKIPGIRARIGRGVHRKKGQSVGVAYRHVGITTGAWMSMDNTSIFSRPSSFITTRPIRYEPPLFLCPPKQAEETAKDK